MHLEERSRVTIERKTKKVDPLTTDEIEMICRWDTDERHETQIVDKESASQEENFSNISARQAKMKSKNAKKAKKAKGAETYLKGLEKGKEQSP